MTVHASSTPTLLVMAVITVVTGGCTTSRSPGLLRDQLIGVIRDERGNPVAGALVSTSPLRRSRSDSAGRFRIENLSTGNHTLTVSAEGHQGVTQQVYFASRTQFVQVTLVSLAELTEQAIAALHLGYYQRAQLVADRMMQVNPDDERTVLVLQLIAAGGELER